MTFFNRGGEEFTPIKYPGADYLVHNGVEGTSSSDTGLYYRTRVFPALSQEVSKSIAGEQPFSELSLDALQAWSEEAWKEPHGSKSATERFEGKFYEEVSEAVDAFREYMQTGDNVHFVEEIGDVYWVVNALASNSRTVISDGLKERLYEYTAGTRTWVTGIAEYPDWYDDAGKVAVKRGAPTVKDIDDLICVGFAPAISPAMNHYDNEPMEIPGDYLHEMRFYLAALCNLGEQLHGSERVLPVEDARIISTDMGKIAAESVLRVAAMAHYVGASFEDVVERNILKISQRINLNLIDKGDGDRGKSV